MSILVRPDFGNYTFDFCETIIEANSIEEVYDVLYNDNELYSHMIYLNENGCLTYYSTSNEDTNDVLILKTDFFYGSGTFCINNENKTYFSSFKFNDDLHEKYKYDKKGLEQLKKDYYERTQKVSSMFSTYSSDMYNDYFNNKFKKIDRKYLIENKLSKDSFIKMLKFFDDEYDDEEYNKPIFDEYCDPILEIEKLEDNKYKVSYRVEIKDMKPIVILFDHKKI